MPRKRKATKSNDRGKRISVWIPESDQWVLRVILKLRRRAEERGVPLSQGDLVRLALAEYLRDSVSEEDHIESEDPVPSKTPRITEFADKRTIVFRKKDRWVAEYIDKLVDGKRHMGIDTSFSYELTRLVKAGLLAVAKETGVR